MDNLSEIFRNFSKLLCAAPLGHRHVFVVVCTDCGKAAIFNTHFVFSQSICFSKRNILATLTVLT
jgi:hypothetical protein